MPIKEEIKLHTHTHTHTHTHAHLIAKMTIFNVILMQCVAVNAPG